MPSSRRQQKRGRVRHTMKPTKTVSVLGMPGSSHQHAMSLGKSRKVSVTCLPSRAIRVVESQPSISNHRQVIMRIMTGCCEMLQSNHGHVWTDGCLPIPTVGLSPCCRMSRLGEPFRSLISGTTIRLLMSTIDLQSTHLVTFYFYLLLRQKSSLAKRPQLPTI